MSSWWEPRTTTQWPEGRERRFWLVYGGFLVLAVLCAVVVRAVLMDPMVAAMGVDGLDVLVAWLPVGLVLPIGVMAVLRGLPSRRHALPASLAWLVPGVVAVALAVPFVKLSRTTGGFHHELFVAGGGDFLGGYYAGLASLLLAVVPGLLLSHRATSPDPGTTAAALAVWALPLPIALAFQHS